jgi:thiosulfate/3-mercaptopyruvate sulfurtransferase
MRALVPAGSLLREDSADLVLVDVQWSLTTSSGPAGRDLYAAAHLPGAHHVDLDAELAGPPGPGGRHPMPTAHAVQEALRRCGAHATSRVVVYDQGPSYAASRAWWVFRYFGVEDVRVLDGGLRAWAAAGGPVTADVPTPRPRRRSPPTASSSTHGRPSATGARPSRSTPLLGTSRAP